MLFSYYLFPDKLKSLTRCTKKHTTQYQKALYRAWFRTYHNGETKAADSAA